MKKSNYGEYKCPFCDHKGELAYQMGRYSVYQCIYCGTGGVSPLPTKSEIAEFYDGFMFCANSQNYPGVLTGSKLLFSQLKLKHGCGLKMLDVGGGGGFYSKAFEDLGYGKSTYVDLDPQACDFARGQLGVENIINDDVLNLDGAQKFDFIMCRHLIEHLLNPSVFVEKIINCLAPGGTLLLVFPNGQSLEYLAYPGLGLVKRMQVIKEAQKTSLSYILLKFLSGKILHGIDPPRHLWAISKKGIDHFLKSRDIDYEISTYPLTDPAYSPYFKPVKPYEKIQCFFGNMITSRIFGGTHLAVTIRNKKK